MTHTRWDDVGVEHLGSPTSRALFGGWWSLWSERMRARWAGNFDIQSRMWQDYPRVDPTSVTCETWCDVITIQDAS